MPADAATSSPSVSDLQRRIEELNTELRARNAERDGAAQREAAMAEVLQVINASPQALTPVFDAILERAMRLCEAAFGLLDLYDGRQFRTAATLGVPGPLAEHRSANSNDYGPGTAPAQLVAGALFVHVADAAESESYKAGEPERRAVVDLGGARTLLVVPLRKDDALLGMIAIYRNEVRPFSDSQITLLQRFAEQAVIAMDNARLMAETREALEQQTATAEVLRVISQSPTDVQPVLKVVVTAARRFCGAEDAAITLRDGTDLVLAAHEGPVGSEPVGHRVVLDRTSGRGRSILDAATVHLPDILAADATEYAIAHEQARSLKFRAHLSAPMLRNDGAIGCITLRRPEPGAFTPRQIALLESFAAQAVIAIENVRLFAELRERTRDLAEAFEYQSASGEVLNVISRSPTDTQPVFEAIAESAARLCQAEFCNVFRFDGELIHLMASYGCSPEAMAAMRHLYPMPPGRGSCAARAILNGGVEQVPDVRADRDYAQGNVTDIMKISSIVAVPMLKEGHPVGAIALLRVAPGFFPQRQIELLQTFADQAVIAINNVRLFDEVQARARDLQESLEYQTATSDVLQVISRSTFDLQSVLDTLSATAARLCLAEMSFMTRRTGDSYRFVTAVGATPETTRDALRLKEDFLDHRTFTAGRESITGRVVVEKDVVQIVDVAADPDYAQTEIHTIGKMRTLLGVPLMREGTVIGTMSLGRQRIEPFTEKQIELVKTFADQAVIAIENARLLGELHDRTRDLEDSLEHQIATSDVLKVISRSTFDLHPVLQTLAETAIRLCEAEMCYVLRREGEAFRATAVAASSPQAAADAIEYQRFLEAHPLSPGRGSLTGRVALEQHAVQIDDVTADAEYVLTEATTLGKIRTQLGVPLMREGAMIGVIILSRQRVAPFSDRQIDLLRTFADQAVIAIENTRLLTEQREALEQQTATAEVLQVINSSPGNLTPVFEAMLEKAMRLCDAAFGGLWTFEGDRYVAAALRGVPQPYAEFLADTSLAPPGPGTAPYRFLRGEHVVHNIDLAAEEPYRVGEPNRHALVDLGGARTALQVALRRDGSLLGVITIYRQEVRPFSEKQIALLQNFAAQAVIAMENARLMTETREALEQQTATAEVLQVINSSPGDLAPVFEAMLEKAMRLCQAAFGVLRTYDGRLFHTAAARGVPTEYGEYLAHNPETPGPGTIAARILEGASQVHVVDLTAEKAYQAGVPARRALVDLGGARTSLAVPLTKDGIVHGVIQIYRQQTQAFSDKQIALLQNFAAQAVIAMENARLLTEQREALEQQTATAEVLQAINTSPGNLAPVFETILRKAHALCGVAYGSLQLYDGTKFRAAAVHSLPEPLARRLREGYTPGPNFRRLIDGADFAHVPDMAAIDDPMARVTVAVGIRTLLTVALRKDGRLLGQIVSARKEVRPFADKEIALLRSFAAQAVIAMENARLLTEQREALEQQTATAEVLQVINSSPGNLAPVFVAMLDKALNLCSAAFGVLWTYDGEYIHATAIRGATPAYTEFLTSGPHRPGQSTAHARLLRGSDIEHIPDVADSDDYRSGEATPRALVDLGGGRSLLAAALRKDGAFLGDIVIYRREVRPFADKEIALLQSFAAQAVIAMENARLLTEQREALEQQTATTEVLQVINSSPGDLAPVFDAMLEKAMRLCAAAFGYLMTHDGERFQVVAHQGLPPRFAEYLRDMHQPSSAGLYAAIRSGAAYAQERDLSEGEVYQMSPLRRALVDLGGARTGIVVALRKDDALLGVITIYRQEVRPFADKEIALLQSFAAQAVIAMENARLITEQREALEQQTATAEVLEVINASPGNLAPVFDAMLERAVRLSESAFGMMNLYQDGKFKNVALRGAPPGLMGGDSRPQPGPHNPLTRLVNGEDLVHIEDLKIYHSYLEGDPRLRNLVDVFGARSLLVVALRKDDALIGTLSAYRQEVRPFTDKQIALLQNFAAQAVIAMENARLLTEQREALQQQTATAEVLEVINASPGNLAPVFDAMLERAVRLSESAFGMMNLYENNRFKGVALRGVPPGILSWEAAPQPGPHNALTRLVNGEDVVHIEDLKAYRSYVEGDPRTRNLVDICGARSLLAVALRKDGKLVGTLTAYRQEVRPFSDKQIALLEGFAAQAVIAIENARLLDELRQRQAELARSVDELTATGDVLKIISRSSVDLKTVLDTLVERVARLCHADQGYMFRRHDELHHLVAAYGVSPAGEEFIRTHPFLPERGTTSGRVAMERRPVQIEDVCSDPEYTYNEGQQIAGFRTMLGIPLLREDTLVGVFVLGRTRVEPFTDKEIELVTSFADQAVIAIENARLFEEIRQRQAELRVTFDNMGDGVAMFDAGLRLAAWNRNFQRIIGLSDADLAARPTYADYLRLLADRGEFGTENVEAALASRIKDTDRELRLERTRADGTVIEARRNAVPGGGFVLIYSDITERKRSEEEIRAARDLAETRLRELRAAQSSLIHAEKMASLGQLTAGIAHEIKNPLNFVNNFAGLSVELLDELREAMTPVREALDDGRRTEIDETIELLNINLDKIASHGRRADGIVRSMLLHSRGGSSDRQSVDINAVLEEALNLAYHGARAQDQSFNVTLERELQPDIAPIEIVPQDVTRVFLNLIGNGFYAVARRARLGDASFRPTLKVRTRELGEAVEIAIRDNGTGISPEHRERLFQPFFTTKPTGEGTGLGLSISYDIVTQQHGGMITVDSEPGHFTEFIVRLPRRGAATVGRGRA